MNALLVQIIAALSVVAAVAYIGGRFDGAKRGARAERSSWVVMIRALNIGVSSDVEFRRRIVRRALQVSTLGWKMNVHERRGRPAGGSDT